MAQIREVIYISSDEDDDLSKPFHRLFWLDTLEHKKHIPAKKVDFDEDDDDCVILDLDECMVLDGDPDPDKPVQVAKDSVTTGSEELLVVAEKGQIACRDYPHARHLCITFPFNTSPHEKYCDLCHCYVCDTRAPCVSWGTGKSGNDHCHSTEKEYMWRELRESSKQMKVTQIPVVGHRTTTLSDEPPMHAVVNPSSFSEDVQLREFLRALSLNSSPSDVQGGRLTGTVKWFNSRNCYGFIIPDSGGEDLYVHRSSIKSEGIPRLTEGEKVEFQIETVDHGRNKAINVSGPGGSFIQGTSRRDNCGSHSSITGGRGGSSTNYGGSNRLGDYRRNNASGGSLYLGTITRDALI